jgi:hypothetical protein
MPRIALEVPKIASPAYSHYIPTRTSQEGAGRPVLRYIDECRYERVKKEDVGYVDLKINMYIHVKLYKFKTIEHDPILRHPSYLYTYLYCYQYINICLCLSSSYCLYKIK